MDLITYTYCPNCGNAAIAPKLSVKDHSVSGQLFDIWQCNACSLRFTQNVPALSEIGRYYQSDNYISHTDTKKGLVNTLYHLVRHTTLRRKKVLIESATAIQGGNLLDIGAGTGAFCGYMKKHGWAITGLEPDEATRNRAATLHGVALRHTDELMQLPAASFDAVTLWHVLEHVHALHDYMHQVRRVLKTEGKAFIAVPNYTSYDAGIYKAYWAAYDVPRHLYHFSPLSMKRLLRQHGLKLLHAVPMWYDSFYVSMLSEQYRKGVPAYLAAIQTGLISNIKAMLNKERCSSLIYIIDKA